MRKAPGDGTAGVTKDVEAPGLDELALQPPSAGTDDGEPGPEAAAPDAFDSFVAAHGSRLLRTALLLTGDHPSAEDLVQETLMRAWSRWHRVGAADEPGAYVRRMLVNTSVSRWRAVRHRLNRERLVEQPPERVWTDPAVHDDQLWAVVCTLPPRQRAVVVLSYYEDLSDGQVADALGTAIGTVKSQRAKALRTLRTRLGEEET
jgi:RNA polymerase sigma-70 factor, ECF subfamily